MIERIKVYFGWISKADIEADKKGLSIAQEMLQEKLNGTDTQMRIRRLKRRGEPTTRLPVQMIR